MFLHRKGNFAAARLLSCFVPRYLPPSSPQGGCCECTLAVTHRAGHPHGGLMLQTPASHYLFQQAKGGTPRLPLHMAAGLWEWRDKQPRAAKSLPNLLKALPGLGVDGMGTDWACVWLDCQLLPQPLCGRTGR